MPDAISGVGRLAAKQGTKAVTEAYQRPSTIHDARYVADNMRAEDAAELQACSGIPPDEAMLLGFFHSKPCMTMVGRDGRIMGMWGVTPEGTAGRIWMLGTEKMSNMRQDKRVFLRKARAQLELLFNHYPVLFNWVDARNVVHVRWLQHMGFTFVAKHPEWGVERRLFYEFVRIKPCVNQQQSSPALRSLSELHQRD